MNLRRRVALPVALVCLALSGRLQAGILDQVPSNAIAVIKCNNLNATNAKEITLIHKFGLDEMVPDLKDPLGTMLAKHHITQGFNKDGDLAVALFPRPDNVTAGDDLSYIALIPVSDYKAFVGNFTNPTEADGITTATDSEGKPVLIAHWDTYAAVSETKDLLAKKPDGFKVAGLAQKEEESKDITVLANLDQIRTVGLPKLKEERDKAMQEIEQKAGTDPKSKQMLPIVKAVVNVYMTVVQEYLEQGTSGVFSINFSDDGIALATFAEFKPDSPVGQNFAALKGDSTTSLLTGLPDKKYLFVGGAAADPKAVQTLVSHLVLPALADIAASSDSFKPLVDLGALTQTSLGSFKSSASGLLVPDAAAMQNGFIQGVGVTYGDSKQTQATARAVMQFVVDTVKNQQPAGPNQASVVFQKDAKTVDGVSLDHLQGNLMLDPNDPKMAQIQPALNLLYGPNGIGSYLGIASDHAFIKVSGGNDQTISDLIASAKAEQDAIDGRPYIASVAAHLARKPVLVEYFFLDNLAKSATGLAANFGFPIKLTLPDDLPPIGLSASADGPSFRVDTFVPADLIQNLIAAGLKAKQDMQANPNGPQ